MNCLLVCHVQNSCSGRGDHLKELEELELWLKQSDSASGSGSMDTLIGSPLLTY